MKFKNTFFSFLRHALTTGGGALAMSENPQHKLIGSLMVAIGGLWGVGDEHKAENPGGGLKLPPGGGTAASLLLCALLGLGLGLANTACTTTATSAKQTQITAAVLNLAGTSMAPVLKNNPTYIPAAQAVQEALGTLSDGQLDAAKITAWVAQVAAHKKWDAAQTIYAQTLCASAWSIYTTSTGQNSAAISDPNVQLWLKAFREGLGNAVLIARAQ